MENKHILNIEWMDINQVYPYTRNSRRNDPTIDQVVESIKNFGWQQPIVIDNDNIIVAGHSRYKAANQLKYKEIPVVRFTGDKEQAHYYRLLDNRSQEETEWDNDLLKNELIAVKDLYPTGFTKAEIDKILGDNKSKSMLVEKSVFELVVNCDNEQEQQDLYDIVKELGRECRILSI